MEKCKVCKNEIKSCSCSAMEKQLAEGFDKLDTTVKQTAEELSSRIDNVDAKVDANSTAIASMGARVDSLESGSSSAHDEDEEEEGSDPKGKLVLFSKDGKSFEVEKGNAKVTERKAALTVFSPGNASLQVEAQRRFRSLAKRLAYTVTKGAFCDFLKKVMNKKPFEKALSGQTDAAGGFLVPQEHRAVLLEIVEEFGWIRRMSTIIPMGSDEMDMPKLLTEATASWVAESATAPDGDPSFENKTLFAKEARFKTIVPNALLADSSPAIDTILLELFGRAIAKLEDESGFDGAGTPPADPHTGILQDAGTNTVVAAGTVLTFDDLVELEAALTGGARIGAWIYVSRKGFKSLRLVKDDEGRPLWTDNIQDGALGMVLGYPVGILEAGIPDNVGGGNDETRFVLGNLSQVAFGDRESFAVRVSDQVRFEENQTVFMGTERVAITVANPEGFSILTGILA